VFQLGEHLGAVVELGLAAELGKVAAEHHKVRFGLQQIGFGDRANQSSVPVADEAVARDVLDVGVGDVSEGEVLRRIREGELHHADGEGAHRRYRAGALDETASCQF
jgi:hypothetical protein